MPTWSSLNSCAGMLPFGKGSRDLPRSATHTGIHIHAWVEPHIPPPHSMASLVPGTYVCYLMGLFWVKNGDRPQCRDGFMV